MGRHQECQNWVEVEPCAGTDVDMSGGAGIQLEDALLLVSMKPVFRRLHRTVVVRKETCASYTIRLTELDYVGSRLDGQGYLLQRALGLLAEVVIQIGWPFKLVTPMTTLPKEGEDSCLRGKIGAIGPRDSYHLKFSEETPQLDVQHPNHKALTSKSRDGTATCQSVRCCKIGSNE